MSDIAVVIVNYRAADLAIEGIASVFDHAPPAHRITVHIVDNASPGDDVDRIAAVIEGRGWEERVVFHRETVNHGFGRGNNLVLTDLATDNAADYAFLLNPDARLTEDVLSPLVEEIERAPDIGFTGAGIVNPGGARATAAFRFPTPLGVFAGASRFGPIARLLRRWEVPMGPDAPSGPVDWVPGAAVLIRMEALRAIDFFDPAYFLYYEEVDLMLRARRAGWRTTYLGETVVEHVEGVSTDVKSGRAERRRSPRYLYESWLHYFRSNHGRLGLAAATAAWAAGAALDAVVSTLRGRSPGAPLRFWSDFSGVVIRPQLGLAPRYD